MLAALIKEAKKYCQDKSHDLDFERLDSALASVKKSTHAINELQNTADKRVQAREESVVRKTGKKVLKFYYALITSHHYF